MHEWLQFDDISAHPTLGLDADHAPGWSQSAESRQRKDADTREFSMSLNEYIAGAAGGIAGMIVGHPFDTTKVQMQIRTAGDHSLKRSTDAFYSVAAQGLKNGLFRGMMFPVLSYGLINSIFFGVYGNTLRLLEPDHTKQPRSLQIYLAGCVAGTAQLAIACPVEVIKCTLQAQIPLTMPKSKTAERGLLHTRPAIPRTFYKGPFECTRQIFANEGIPGFYKGLSAMLIRDIPGYGFYFWCYEALHKFIIHRNLSDKHGVVAAIVAGGLAGCASWLAVMPLDVIKSRLQTSTAGFEQGVDHGGPYRGFWHCAYQSVKKGGVLVLYRGAGVTMIRAFPVNAITFLVYSQMVKHLN